MAVRAGAALATGGGGGSSVIGALATGATGLGGRFLIEVVRNAFVDWVGVAPGGAGVGGAPGGEAWTSTLAPVPSGDVAGATLGVSAPGGALTLGGGHGSSCAAAPH